MVWLQVYKDLLELTRINFDALKDEKLDTSALWHTLRKKVSLIDSPEV